MTDEEIIEKIRNNTWWPFDRVDPKLIAEAMKRDKKQERDNYEEALL